VAARDKILSREELLRRRAAAAAEGRRVVFTNGCFDLLHPGHVRYLEEARALGDVLVVAVNADASARRLGKGAGRPYNDERTRAEVVAALAAVDYVTVFGEDTPLALITALRPDVLVKGGDWPVEDIVGADAVRAAGGVVRSLPSAKGFATTALIAKIKQGGV
jgi:D-beta-D-heptose 7-phosphate kinase/D-beta-D-heptose 1-phosphate adenosyltransferase